MPKNQLEDVKINVKVKLASMWTAVTLCYLYGDYFELYVPGKVNGLLIGLNLLDSPLKLLLAAVFLAIPALMVCLSVILKPNINKTLNIIFSLFFTMVMLLIAFNSFKPWKEFYFLLALVESAITILIFWHSLKWPKTNEMNVAN